jgi:hypothetical protein
MVVVAVIMVVIVMMMVVAMVMVVMVPMIMVVIMIVRMAMGMLGQRTLQIVLSRLHQLFHGHLLLGGFSLFENVVDDLFLEDRRAQFRESGRILLVIFVDDLLLTGIPAGLIDEGALELFLVHLQLLLVADLAEHQAQPYAPLGDLAIKK